MFKRQYTVDVTEDDNDDGGDKGSNSGGDFGVDDKSGKSTEYRWLLVEGTALNMDA